MPSKACLGEIYGHKYLIMVHVMLCALWDAFERVDYEEWVIGLTEISLGEYLWMLRQRSTNLDGTKALVISRGLSNAYDHEMSTLLAIARGEWLLDESKVPLADVALALHAHGVLKVEERGVISLEGSVLRELNTLWGILHPLGYNGRAPPQFPIDAAHLVLIAQYEALGNRSLRERVRLALLVWAMCSTGDRGQLKLTVYNLVEGTADAYRQAADVVRPHMRRAKTAALAAKRFEVALVAVQALAAPAAAARAAFDALPAARSAVMASGALVAGGGFDESAAGGGVELAASRLASSSALGSAFVAAFVGDGADVSRAGAVAGLDACIDAVQRTFGTARAGPVLDVLRSSLARVAVPDGGVLVDGASSNGTSTLVVVCDALTHVAHDLGVDDALRLFREGHARAIATRDAAVEAFQTAAYGAPGPSYGGSDPISGGMVPTLRALVDFEKSKNIDDAESRGARQQGWARAATANLIRASAHTHELVLVTSSSTWEAHDNGESFARIRFRATRADARLCCSQADGDVRRIMSTESVAALLCLRTAICHKHTGRAVDPSASGIDVMYLAREARNLWNEQGLGGSAGCLGAPLRVGLGCVMYERKLGGLRRYEINARLRNHYGPVEYFSFGIGGAGDISVCCCVSASSDVDAKTLLERASALTASDVQRVLDGSVAELPWRSDSYSASDQLPAPHSAAPRAGGVSRDGRRSAGPPEAGGDSLRQA